MVSASVVTNYLCSCCFRPQPCWRRTSERRWSPYPCGRTWPARPSGNWTRPSSKCPMMWVQHLVFTVHWMLEWSIIFCPTVSLPSDVSPTCSVYSLPDVGMKYRFLSCCQCLKEMFWAFNHNLVTLSPVSFHFWFNLALCGRQNVKI